MENGDRIKMMIIIYNLVILLTTFISATKAIEISGNCSSRSCLGTKVQYPFGFSENCEFQLDCKSNGRMEFKGYDIRSIQWNSIILNFPPNCSRSITEIRHLFGKNYALTNLNGLHLQNCVKPFTGCMIPQSLLESRFALCGLKKDNMSCYDSKNGILKGELLRYEDVIDSRCDLLYSSIVVDSFVSGGNPDTWLEFEAVQVGWWINGECRCHDNDMVAHVGDFGLARFHLQSSSRISSSSLAVKGTVGYAAPEYGLGSRVSKKGDIYSFGIVLIEMMIAESPTAGMFKEGLDLHKYAKKALLTDRLSRVVDPRLVDDSDGAGNGNQDINSATNVCNMKCIKSLIQVGLKCSVDSPQNRIKIEDAIKELQVTKDTFLEELRIINRYMY